ncbi:MAG: hypothetical protein AAFV53_35620, partial [Myxococcota bacterium]
KQETRLLLPTSEERPDTGRMTDCSRSRSRSRSRARDPGWITGAAASLDIDTDMPAIQGWIAGTSVGEGRLP